jgi:S-methylmethionine-dependent homocysteine/selenocysteine methylase
MLDAASVGLVAYASDELGRKHRHWTASVGCTGASIDRASDASVATVHDRWFSNELDMWRRTERQTRL